MDKRGGRGEAGGMTGRARIGFTVVACFGVLFPSWGEEGTVESPFAFEDPDPALNYVSLDL